MAASPTGPRNKSPTWRRTGGLSRPRYGILSRTRTTLWHSFAYCRVRRLYPWPLFTDTSAPRSSERDWPSSTFLLSNLAIMHSQLDFDACPAMQALMKPLCASRGYSYFPFGGAFGSGLIRGLPMWTVFGGLVTGLPGLAGMSVVCVGVVVGRGAFFEIVLCVEVFVGVPVDPVAPVFALALATVGVLTVVALLAVFFVEPQPVAMSATASSKEDVKRGDLSIGKAYPTAG